MAGAVHGGVTRYLMDAALSRQAPKHLAAAERRLSGGGIDPQIQLQIHRAARQLQGAGCEPVEITARDGTKLVGHWRSCPGTRRILIAMHGWRSSWAKDFGLVADFWYENRCSVLFAEQRGQGGSGGAYMGFGAMERYDCLDWIQWVNRSFGTGKPVYLAGISMGASTVLMAGGLDLPNNVRGILADCGYTSPDAIWRHVAEHNLHVHYGLHRPAIHALCKKRLGAGAADSSCVDALGRCTIPVLLVHGTEDSFVPVTMTYENYKACAGPKRLLIVPGAEHGMSYLVDRPGYERAVRQFWAEFDGAGGERGASVPS